VVIIWSTNEVLVQGCLMTDADGPLTLPEQESSAQLVVFDIGR